MPELRGRRAVLGGNRCVGFHKRPISHVFPALGMQAEEPETATRELASGVKYLAGGF